jgi:hypothetical protein
VGSNRLLAADSGYRDHRIVRRQFVTALRALLLASDKEGVAHAVSDTD